MTNATRENLVASAVGIVAFFAAVPVSRVLRRRFPKRPFLSQVVVGGSLVVGTYCIAKAFASEQSRVPETLLASSWGAFGGAYQAMQFQEDDKARRLGR